MTPSSAPPASNALLPENLDDEQLVTAIVYLASLASEVKAVDPLMDSLRMVTAHWQPPASLSAEDRAVLVGLMGQLEDYLINHDPLRAFTPETLGVRVQSHLAQGPSNYRNFTFGSAVSFSLLAAMLLIMLLPLGELTARILVIPTLFQLLCVIGTVWLYGSSFFNFKPELQRAFIYQCAGVLGLGVLVSHFLIIQVFGLTDKPLFAYGGLPILGAIAIGLITMGLRETAKLLGIQDRFVSLRVWAGIFVLAISLGAFMAFVVPVTHPLYYGISVATMWMMASVAFFGIVLARRIHQTVTAAYRNAIGTLSIFMVCVLVASPIYVGAISWFGGLSPTVLGIALSICATPPILVILYSGYLFKAETGR